MTHDITSPDGTPLSSFAFGTMQFGDGASHAESREMYDACRAAGINFFDTAHNYTGGKSETFLGEFAAGERDKLVIATKHDFPNGAAPAVIDRSLDECLERLKMDHVDIFYLHRWDDDTPLERTFAALAKAQQAGRFTHIGVSNFAAWQVMKAQGVAQKLGTRIAMIQPMYNLVKRQVEVEILPMAIAEGFAVVPYSPLGGGLLTGKYGTGGGGRLKDNRMYAGRYSQKWMYDTAVALGDLAREVGENPITLAVAWAAHHPGVTAPIISGRNLAQLQPSLDALSFTLDDDLYARLSALSPTPAPATDRLEEA